MNKSLSDQITHYDLPRLILNAAGIKSNFMFLNERIDMTASWIRNNSSRLIALNKSLWHFKDTAFTIQRRGEEIFLNFLDYETSARIQENTVISFSLTNYLYGSKPLPWVSTYEDVERHSQQYITGDVKLLIVPQKKGFVVYLGAFLPSGKAYATEGDSLQINWADFYQVQSDNNAYIRNRNKATSSSWPQIYVTALGKEGALLSLKSAGYEPMMAGIAAASLGLHNNPMGVLTGSQKLEGGEGGGCCRISLPRGITLVRQFKDGTLVYSSFDTNAFPEEAVRFMEILQLVIDSHDFWALVVQDEASFQLKPFANKLYELKLPALAELGFREPYIAFLDTDGVPREIKPGWGEHISASKTKSVLSVDIFLEAKKGASLTKYDPLLYQQIETVGKNMKKSFWRDSDTPFYQDSKAFIAHAGGAIDGHTYTNSREALEQSIAHNYTFIELDLVETTDGRLIAAHDWLTFNRITGYPEQEDRPLSLAEVKQRKIYGKYTPLIDEDITTIFQSHSNLILVTDKIKNFEAIVRQFPFSDRLIVEVFSIEDYVKAWEYGLKYPAYCINDSPQLALAQLYPFRLVTASGLALAKHLNEFEALHKQGVTIMAFSAGMPTEMAFDTGPFYDKYMGKVMSLSYSDFWSPKLGARLPQTL